MCQRCVELDRIISECEWLISGVNDRVALGLLHYEIGLAREEKAALHPTEQSRRGPEPGG
jgi:hypothetical protein